MSNQPEAAPGAGTELSNPIPLSEWMARMAKLAGYDSADAMIAETGACCWMHFYTDGYTPGEAWAEECSDG